MRAGIAGTGGSRRAETRGDEVGGCETRTSCGAAFANARSAGTTAPDDDIGRRPLVPPPTRALSWSCRRLRDRFYLGAETLHF